MSNRMKTQTNSPSPTWGWGMRLVLAGLSIVFMQSISAQSIETNLNSGWQFRQVGTEIWYPATVPGTVHTDLLANGLIDDPFKDNNEKKLQWIEKENWEYRMVFNVDAEQLNHKHHELYFEGLDTYAEVFLNGEKILDANNMFRSWRVDVSGKLKEKGNELHILFTSPILKNDSIARANVKLPGGTDTSAYPVWPYTRKAAYHFSWDWAPRFVTTGIWKNVFLESWSDFVLRDVTHTMISINDTEAVVKSTLKVESGMRTTLNFLVHGQAFSFALKEGQNSTSVQFRVKNPKRWWPNGEGEAHLYTIETKLIYPGTFNNYFQTDVQKIGLRTIELVNEPDSIGTSFYFKVNGKPIFMKGANYVPQDVFLPRVKPEQYERLLKQVKDAGMNMLRVWGGGVYEREIFYALCDEYGILVWQDFMFAGTMYPIDSSFKENVTLEVAEQIARLKKHPCLALWCGNNEIEVAWKNWGWQKQYSYSEDDSTKLWNSYTNLFETELNALVAIIDGKTPYVPTSPQSNWGTPKNFNHGSMHYWGTWHGNDDFSGFEKNIGRFMVEWGFQSYPDYDLLAEYISPENLLLDAEAIQNRQKSYVGNKKILDFINQYRIWGGEIDSISFEFFVQQSQIVQALGYEQALKAHLSNQPHCMGTLLWQLNDCWPGASWSIINYNGKPKAAYWEVKRVLTD